MVDILGRIVGNVTGNGTSHNVGRLIIHVDIGLQVHLLVTDNLCNGSRNNIQDVAVAFEFLGCRLTDVGQLTHIVPDTHRVADEGRDAHLFSNIH